MHSYPKAPFKKGGRITTQYGKTHKALDISPRNDDDGQVFAVAGGTVTDTEDGMWAGGDHSNMVIVRGTDTILTVYGHVAPSVGINESVKKGDKLGDVDLSGESDGLHVHLARLPAGTDTVQAVIEKELDGKGIFFAIASLKPWK